METAAPTPPPATPSDEPPPARSGFRWSAPESRRRLWFRRLLPALIAILLGIAAGIGVASAIHMPRVESLADFKPARITQLLDDQGKPFASYARQRRIVLGQDEIPERVRQAVIAVEDSNFYSHGGLDALGILRATFANLRRGKTVEGASTLTMQLARQLFSLNPQKLWRRKFEEAMLAVELEKTFSKDQLLTLYLNVIFLGHGQYGVEAAARFYFGKPASELSIAQAAMLAGIYQRPSKLSPYNAPDAVLTRRNHVIERMFEEGFIKRNERDEALAEPLGVTTHGPRDELGSYFSEEVRRYLEETYGTAALLEQGLQVETTMDPAIEASAEKALRAGLVRLDRRKGWRGPHFKAVAPNLDDYALASWNADRAVADGWFEGLVLSSETTHAVVKAGDNLYTLTPEGMSWTGKRSPKDILKRGDVAWFRIGPPPGDEKVDIEREPILLLEQEPQLQGAAIVLESATGAVRAMVGGWDFSRNQFNRAVQARRQVGSAFKVFVYGAALENGFTPATTLFDAPVYFKGADGLLSYSPSNYYPTYYGVVTLSKALEHSYNVTAVKLLDLVGVNNIIDLARRAGVSSDLPPYPSLALGAADLSPMELIGAYAAIANQGKYNQPYFVERVRTPEGQTLEQRRPVSRSVMPRATAYVLTHMLEGVVDRGTAHALADLKLDLAGKTGTTNDYSNAWFVGFTPRYTMLIWVGYDHPRSMGRGMAGDKVAVPIWRDLALDGLASGWLQEGQRFDEPPGITDSWVDRGSGLLSAAGAEGAVPMAFLTGTQPEQEWSASWSTILSLPWYQQRPFYTPKPHERMPEDYVPPPNTTPVPPEGSDEAPG